MSTTGDEGPRVTVFWLHLRNSPIRWALPAMIGLNLALLFFRSRYWIGVWPETGAAGQMGTYFVGALGAGAAAWAAGAPTRHRLQEQLVAARVRAITVEAYRLAATVAVLLVPYLVGQAVAVAFTAWSSPPGFQLWAGYFALGLVAMLLAVCWGWILGKLLGSIFASLTAAVGWLVLIILAEDYLGITINALRGPPERMVDPVAVGLQLAMLVILLATLPLLAKTSRILGHVRPAFMPAVAAIGVVAVMSATTTIVDREPIRDRAHCVQGERTMLCVWPEHEKYVPLLEQVNERIDALPESLIVPPRMNEHGVERTQFIDDEGYINTIEGLPPTFVIIEGSPWSYTGAIAGAIMSETWGDCFRRDRTDADRLRTHALSAWLNAYLVGSGSPDFSTNAPPDVEAAWAEGRAMAEASLTEQFAWVEREITDLRQSYCPGPDAPPA